MTCCIWFIQRLFGLLFLKHASHFALVSFLLERLALIILFLTLSQGDDHFAEPLFIDEHPDGYDGKAWVFAAPLQLLQLFAVKQQLAVAAGRVVIVGTIEVLSDVHVLHPQFAVGKIAEGIDQAGFAQAYRFDFCTSQHDTGGIGIDEGVVERGSLVLYVYRGLKI